MMNSEWHVSGLVVQARPESFPQLVTALLAIADTEIPAQDQQNGKLVVVMQAACSQGLLEKIESVRNLEGVLAVSLVYHQQDTQGEVKP